MSFQSVPSVSTTFPCWVPLAGTLDCFSCGNEKVLLSGIVWTPIRYVTLETSAAQLRSVTEMAPRSPFSCVNRCPIRYDFRAGVTFSLKREEAMQISWNKGKIWMRKEFSSHRIFLGSLTWSRFYCFGKLITWQRRRHVNEVNKIKPRYNRPSKEGCPEEGHCLTWFSTPCGVTMASRLVTLSWRVSAALH